MRIKPSSDRSVLVAFGEEISIEAHRAVLRLTEAVLGMPGVVNVHPAYASVLIDFDPLAVTHADIEEAAREAYERSAVPPAARTVEIPVRYGGSDGPDLEDVARLTGQSCEDVIAIHSGADYVVYFLGFSPGFPYLGGMPESIAVPRLATPRRSVPAGSVAIGGRQTGVYPVASPGGWRIIGRTDLPLFDADAESPVRLRMGDHVKFVPISGAGF